MLGKHNSLKLVILNEVKIRSRVKHKGTKLLLIAIADAGYDHTESGNHGDQRTWPNPSTENHVKGKRNIRGKFESGK